MAYKIKPNMKRKIKKCIEEKYGMFMYEYAPQIVGINDQYFSKIINALLDPSKKVAKKIEETLDMDLFVFEEKDLPKFNESELDQEEKNILIAALYEYITNDKHSNEKTEKAKDLLEELKGY